jgi:hypothetical protein
MFRKWLALLLIVLLPLQSVWAAAASHAANNDATVTLSDHSAQHNHAALSAAATEQADADCQNCHANCCHLLVTVATSALVFSKRNLRDFAVSALRFESISLDRPDRPNW